jgi:hypothetical protein
MDAKAYCDHAYMELTELKAKIYDIFKGLSRQPDEVRARLKDQTDELHALVDDLTKRLNELKTQCPTDWRPHKLEIEAKKRR